MTTECPELPAARPRPCVRCSRVARGLAAASHDTVHVGDLDLLGSIDDIVMQTARAARRVLISADTDFGELLALGSYAGPSVVLLRRSPHEVEDQVRILLAGLNAVADELAEGAIVVLTPDRIRVRSLPITTIENRSKAECWPPHCRGQGSGRA